MMDSARFAPGLNSPNILLYVTCVNVRENRSLVPFHLGPQRRGDRGTLDAQRCGNVAHAKRENCLSPLPFSIKGRG